MEISNNACEIASIKKLLGEHPDIRLAILFGSLAAGSATSESDVDVAVDTGRPLEVARKIQLISDLAETLGRPVDLVDLYCAGEPLLGQIIGGGVRLLGSDQHYASMLSKHLLDHADFMPYRSRILKERRQAWIGR
jgi:uncharacterized protein